MVDPGLTPPVADPAQEFAQQVAEKWCGMPTAGPVGGIFLRYLTEQLATLIASELRAAGWFKLGKPEKGKPMPYSLDFADIGYKSLPREALGEQLATLIASKLLAAGWVP